MAATGVVDGFEVPAHLEAAEPPEARGLRRDEVRLLVSDLEADAVEHTQFFDLPRWLAPGDVLVVNTSGTLNAAVPATDDDGAAFEIHFSTRLPGGFWTVEVRRPDAVASTPYGGARTGMHFTLPARATLDLLAPYPLAGAMDGRSRLWIAAAHLPCDPVSYLDAHGFPIRYGYVPRAWPTAMYQTVFATEPGSAEMPSAGRPFTPDLVTRLVSRGVEIAPLLLHAGVASLESHEPPYEEYYRVPRRTAERVTAARQSGRRVIAVGTTVVRALETVTADGVTFPGEGWTDVVIAPDRPPRMHTPPRINTDAHGYHEGPRYRSGALRSVDGLISGFHEPRATHLLLLQAVADAARDRHHLQRAYEEALRHGYLWHEFGDSHLILARRSGHG